MDQQTMDRITELNELQGEIARARSELDAAKERLRGLTARDEQIRLEIREDPEARALFGLRAPKKRSRREG